MLILPEEEVMMTLKTFALVLLFFVDIFSLIKYESSISRLVVLREDKTVCVSAKPRKNPEYRKEHGSANKI